MPPQTKKILSKDYSNPDIGLTPIDELSALLCGILMHDVEEDIINSGEAVMDPIDSSMNFTLKNESSYTIRYPNNKFMEYVKNIYKLFTTDPIIDKILPRDEVTEYSIGAMHIDMWNSGFSFLKAWGLNVGKIKDREDNLYTLGEELVGDYLFKLIETLKAFQADSYLARQFYNGKGIRPLIPETFLLLLGSDYNELFDWIMNPAIRDEFQRLIDEDKNPVLIPSPYETDILTNSGETITFFRLPVSKLDTAEAGDSDIFT